MDSGRALRTGEKGDGMPAASATPQLVCRRNERRCGCGNWFNAWGDRHREKCYQCDPVRPKVAERFKRRIDSGMIRL